MSDKPEPPKKNDADVTKQLEKSAKILRALNKTLFVTIISLGMVKGYVLGIIINRLFHKSYFATFVGFPQLSGIFLGACVGGFIALMIYMTVKSITEDPSVEFNFFAQMLIEFKKVMEKPKAFFSTSEKEEEAKSDKTKDVSSEPPKEDSAEKNEKDDPGK